jgi:hypothetical protein
MGKNKQTTFADLIAASDPHTETVECGDFTVTIRELSGRERFDLGNKADEDRWEVLLWLCMHGMIDPKPETEAELDQLKPEWTVKIATSIMRISGVEETIDEAEEAGEGLAVVSDIGGS